MYCQYALHGAEITYYDVWAIHGPENESIAALPVTQKPEYTTLSLYRYNISKRSRHISGCCSLVDGAEKDE